MPMVAYDLHVARVRHCCDLCDQPIFPGDQYARIVSLHILGRYRVIRVRKEHQNPYCPYDPEELPEKQEMHPAQLDFLLAA